MANAQKTAIEGSRPAGAEQRLKRPGIKLSAPPEPFIGKDKNPCRLVYGVASLPLGTPVELEVIFEVAGSETLLMQGPRSATPSMDEDVSR
jgi:hypothetical protein